MARTFTSPADMLPPSIRQGLDHDTFEKSFGCVGGYRISINTTNHLANDIGFARLRAPQISLEEEDAKANPTASDAYAPGVPCRLCRARGCARRRADLCQAGTRAAFPR